LRLIALREARFFSGARRARQQNGKCRRKWKGIIPPSSSWAGTCLVYIQRRIFGIENLRTILRGCCGSQHRVMMVTAIAIS
jgi:hypothetical protein